MEQKDQWTHPVLGTAIDIEASGTQQVIYLAGGCFWGVERLFWELPGIVATATGYMGGRTESPSYVEVCTGITGHAETVRIVYDNSMISSESIVAHFLENHDPTQLDRQGNDVGTQYRSAIWTTGEDQYSGAIETLTLYQEKLLEAGRGIITTLVHRPPAPVFYYAEQYHQAYLFKNPGGYCNHGFNGVKCPTKQQE